MNLRARLDKLAPRSRPTRWEAWHQTADGYTRFVCDQYPGVTLDADELAAYPAAEGVGRILVYRTTPEATP